MDDFAGTLVALLLLCFSVEKGWGVQCYICSWSSRDYVNRTDRCTDLGFHPSRVYVHDCEEGCEEFLLADANGDLEHWRRSCMQRNGQPDNTCHTRTTPAWRIKRCTCTQDLCNGSGRHRKGKWWSLQNVAMFLGVNLLSFSLFFL